MRERQSDLAIADETFDRVLIKSGNHEISCERQPELYGSVLRVLRPGGLFVNLGFLFEDPQERAEVRELARVKDTLAGMTGAALNRHFLLREELYTFLANAGFVGVRAIQTLDYTIRSQVVAEQYFPAPVREQTDLENQAAQVKAVTLRRNGRVRFEGTGSILSFPGEITIARRPTMAETNRSTFQKYPMDFLRKVQAHYEMLERASRHIPDGATILDLGCGIGLLTEHLSQQGLTYLGLDISPEFIQVSKDRYATRSSFGFEVADVASTELGKDTTDVVTLLNTLHLPGLNAVGVLRKAYNVLRPGGRIIVSGPTSQESLTRSEPEILAQLERDGYLRENEESVRALQEANRKILTENANYWSVEGMEALLRHLGFRKTIAASADLFYGAAYLVVAEK
jgi:ubiquinone/menaquinone biosynthesis C-methylase UbiE